MRLWLWLRLFDVFMMTVVMAVLPLRNAAERASVRYPNDDYDDGGDVDGDVRDHGDDDDDAGGGC